MRLLNLSLENWRGVEARDVQFGDGVTLIEGPNEIGKSTIVEAVRMLFTELDSSNKKDVKAIQPVDQDVGSRVEVEVQAGKYHFVYAKTYNKSKQTTLDVSAPTSKQLTGREAHEAVEQMLAETVDMTLWDALLVDQGAKVGLANLQDSTSLARALDEAAGTSSAAIEDTDLYSAVQAEYEKFFTLKTGKSKFAEVEQAFDTAVAELEDAKTELAEVAKDAGAHERSATEVRRLTGELPTLREQLQAHEETWHHVQTLQQQVDTKAQELAAAQTIVQAAQDAHIQRNDLLEDIENNELSLDNETRKQAPLRTRTDTVKGQLNSAQLVISDLKEKTRSARQALDLAEVDERYVQDLDLLAKETKRLEQLTQISNDMKSHLEVAAAISVDDSALDSFREANNRLAIALGKRDAAATTVSVTASQKLELEIDTESVALDEGAVETRAVASKLELRLPGVAEIQITPSQSVAELQEETREAEASMAQLVERYAVKNLEEAVTANQLRADAQRKIDRLKTREEEILQTVNMEEIQQAITSLQAQCDHYLAEREAILAIPDSIADATNQVVDARAALTVRDGALETAQDKAEGLLEEHAELDAGLRVAQQELAGLTAALKSMRKRLEKDRAQNPDKMLEERQNAANTKVEALLGETNSLQTSLKESSPDAARELLSNAKAVLTRAADDLEEEERTLAVLTDRLQQAQADGRFETFESAEHNFEHCETTLESTRRRANAAQLLWTTLNKHRDAAREAYVRPLKEAIERLGLIVFGAGFEVAIDDDWSLISRTLDAKTLAFDDLSVGAKEQLGILVRLAAAQIVSTQGGVPLIIDDALGFSDPSRLETMGAAIAAAGKQSQIIILTSTPGRFTHVGSAEVVKF